jgi:TatD DNase family protein
MIDVHCHINFHKFETDFDEVIKRAFASGVTRIINVGTQVSSSKHAIDLAEKYEELFAIVGIHPHHTDKLTKGHLQRSEESDWYQELEILAKHPKNLGIGEIGMDFYSYKSNGIVDPKFQQDAFEKQIELAHSLQLPLQIHNRQAGEKILEILDYYKDSLQQIPGMFHCMSGDISFLKNVLQRGFYVGFDGNITFEGIAPGETIALSELVAYAPLDRIVVETDSPYLTPVPHRGKRNEPKNVIITAQYIAALKQTFFEHVVDQTTKNVYTIFKKLT